MDGIIEEYILSTPSKFSYKTILTIQICSLSAKLLKIQKFNAERRACNKLTIRSSVNVCFSIFIIIYYPL